jgi:hypothetical protein
MDHWCVLLLMDVEMDHSREMMWLVDRMEYTLECA